MAATNHYELQLDLFRINLSSASSFLTGAKEVVMKHVKPKFAVVDLIGEIYIEGSFTMQEYEILMLCQNYFTTVAASKKYKDEIYATN